MKKNIGIAIIACALLAFNTIRVIKLQSELDNLKLYMNRKIDSIMQDVNSISSDVHETMKKEANQLSVYEWEYGKIDINEKAAEVICVVVPKTYNPEITKATITCNGTDYNLDYINGQYTVAISLPLFGRNEITKVNLIDNGIIRTQEINWVIEPRYEVLPISYAGMGGSATGKPSDEEYIWSTKYSVNVNIDGKKEYQIESIDFVEVLDGNEINRTPIDLSLDGQKGYQEALKKSRQPVPEYRANEIGAEKFEGNVHFLYYLDRNFHIKNGSMLEFYIDVVDGNGLRYRSFVDCMAISPDGQPDDIRMDEKRRFTFAEPVIIFDAEGNKIFEYDSKLFK